MVIVVDASVFVSAAIASDAHHQASVDWLSRWLSRGQPLSVPMLLLIEFAGAIARLTGNPLEGYRAIRLFRRLPQVQFFALDGLRASAAVHMAAELRLRGAGSIYIALARELAVPLVSWDAEQLSRGTRFVATFTPQTFSWTPDPIR
jgi:predicted nucleic acid-binding protein